MSKLHKARVEAAVTKYMTKQNRIAAGPTRTNASPENDVQKELVDHVRKMGWQIHIVEAKATWSEAQGRYIGQSVKQGFPDSIGCMPGGRFFAIEFKAPGKRGTLSGNQRVFLEDKIHQGGFAICCDGLKFFQHVYNTWKCHMSRGHNDVAMQFLLDALPPRKNDTASQPLF